MRLLMPRRRPLGGGGRGRRISVNFVKNLTLYRAGQSLFGPPILVKFKKKLKVDGGLKIGVGGETISTNIQAISKNFPRCPPSSPSLPLLNPRPPQTL